jgi:hypothetical protein
LNFHPQVTVQSDIARIQRGDVHLKLFANGRKGFHLERGWFSLDFGIRESFLILLFNHQGKPPLRPGYLSSHLLHAPLKRFLFGRMRIDGFWIYAVKAISNA